MLSQVAATPVGFDLYRAEAVECLEPLRCGSAAPAFAAALPRQTMKNHICTPEPLFNQALQASRPPAYPSLFFAAIIRLISGSMISCMAKLVLPAGMTMV